MVTGTLNDTIVTPLGRIAVTLTVYWFAEEEYPLIYVSHTNLYECTDDCRKRLTAELSSDDITVIELSCEDVLNTLIALYNEHCMFTLIGIVDFEYPNW